MGGFLGLAASLAAGDAALLTEDGLAWAVGATPRGP
jgi:hypothetical protein